MDLTFKKTKNKKRYDSTKKDEKPKFNHHLSWKDLSVHLHGFGISILRFFLCEVKLGRCK
jgi:hypothetical protein